MKRKPKKPKRFSTPIPVQLDPELLAKIDEVASRMGEARSTVMRMAMRLGIPVVEAELERLRTVQQSGEGDLGKSSAS